MAAQEYGVSLEILAPDREEDVEKQNEFLKKAIEKDPDAILFSPSSFDASDELFKEGEPKKEALKLHLSIPVWKTIYRYLTVATRINWKPVGFWGIYAKTLIDREFERSPL